MKEQAETPLFGVIDIGSNSVRMVIYDARHTPPVKIFNEKVVCPLGRDLSTTRRLNPDAVEKAYKALEAYSILVGIHGVGKNISVVGTAALREAEDGADFIRKVHDITGLSIRIITGDEEARYAARGVLMMDNHANGVVADFGGGSLELARVSEQMIAETVSLPLGAYRVMAMEAPEAGIEHFISPHQKPFVDLPALYAIGGSWRVLAQAYMHEHEEKQSLQGYTIKTQECIDFCHHLKTMTSDEIAQTYRMESHQATLAPVSALTLAVVLSLLRPAHFIVSTAGVRDGVVHEFLSSRPKKG